MSGMACGMFIYPAHCLRAGQGWGSSVGPLCKPPPISHLETPQAHNTMLAFLHEIPNGQDNLDVCGIDVQCWWGFC
jgi:hypothetical protein